MKNLLNIGLLAIFCLTFNQVQSKVYFQETFGDGDAWQERWVQSESSGKEYGKFILTAGKWYGDAEKDKGLQTSQDAHFYSLSTKMEEPFDNKDKTLVVQFSVKFEQYIDCGGGYLKIFDCSLDLKDMNGDSSYLLMFGPDVCGPATKKVHIIFNYKGKNHLLKKDTVCKDDVYPHLYTLIVRPDNTYTLLLDNKKNLEGTLEEDWDMLPPRKIKDPDAKKPEDWDDHPTIPDPEDNKPEEWDKPEHIPDPDATKPEDWDDEMDGEWEPPMIDNPEFKGEWKAKQIDNPEYKGQWVHPETDNPEFTPDPNMYNIGEACAVGLDLWQVKSGTIFDNFLIGDDPEEASKIAEETWGATWEAASKMKDDIDEQERLKAEAAAKEAGEDDDNEDDDDVEPEVEDDLPNEDDDDDQDELDEHDEL